MTTDTRDRELTDSERAQGMAMLRRRDPLTEIAKVLGLTPAATVRELRNAYGTGRATTNHVAGAGTMVAETPVDVGPGPRELTIRDQLGHERLRFFCSRCEYEARHFGDIVRHYQMLHERPS